MEKFIYSATTKGRFGLIGDGILQVLHKSASNSLFCGLLSYMNLCKLSGLN